MNQYWGVKSLKKKKIYCISICSLFFILSFNHISAEICNFENEKASLSTMYPDSYLIEGVPYVSQETSFYCAYASFTMLLNNFEEINTTLQDVVYYSGVGYSLIYPGFFQERIPLSGALPSQSPEDVEFLTGLFGLTRKPWSPEMDSIPEDKYWQEYWTKVKENISNNVPVLTSVDPFKLSSFRRLVDLPDSLWDRIPPSGHAIVIVGYNDINGTVCYNDPAAALFDHPEYGTYAWMNLSSLNEAVISTTGSKYAVLTFKQVSEPLSKQEAFNRSHLRNLEKLRGNLSAYGEIFINLSQGAEFGINGSRLMQSHFEKGIQNRFKTIIIYKKQGKLGIFYRLLKNFAPIVVKLMDLPPGSEEKYTIDAFGRIAIEKSWMANFLYNNTNLSNVCEYEAMLFEDEAEHWDKLSSCYSVFKEKGIFLSFPRAIFLMCRMNNTMGKIIEIEDALVNFKNK
jgi:hypothetical protein